VCLRGPAYNLTYWKWLRDGDKPVQVAIDEHTIIHDRRATFENPLAFATDELFGFDPITEDHRVLRSAQNYASVAIESAGLPENLGGAVVLPDLLRISRYDCVVRTSIGGEELWNTGLVNDVLTAPANERLVWRYQGHASGYLIVPASTVTKPGLQNLECIVIAQEHTIDKLELGAELFGIVEAKDPVTHKEVRLEQQVGKVVCVAT
jgi:hypothetical protein